MFEKTITLSGRFTEYGVDHEWDARQSDEVYEGEGDLDA